MKAVKLLPILREALIASLSRLVPTVLCILVIAAGTATILMTTGRAVGAQRSVLDTLDEAGTRSIVVQAPASAGIDSGFVDRLEGLEGVEWAGAFGPAFDVRNASVAGGSPVAARTVWTTDFQRLGLRGSSLFAAAWANEPILAELGLVDAAGVVTGEDGPEFGIAGTWTPPEFLGLLGSTILIPTESTQPGSVTVAVVLADRPEHVADLARTVTSLIGAADPSSLTVKTSADLAALRTAVDARLGRFGAELLIVTFAATATLIAAMLSGLVVMRRKDFGRRRALGATRGFIMVLLLLQTAIAAVVGVLVGSAASAVSFALSHTRGPDGSFAVGVDILMIAVAAVASLPPAVVASHREPIRELRVP